MEQSEEIKRRVNAALRYADLSQQQFEDEVNWSRSTLTRRLNGSIEFSFGELAEIAKVTDTPLWFLQWGWEGWSRGHSPEEIQRILDSLPPDDPPST
jgi:transcriptional regulator with XRE-family HTH domain